MTRRGWLLFIVMSIVWGIPYLFIKIAVRELDPVMIVFIRVVIAAAILLPVAIHRKVLGQLRKHWFAMIGITCVQIVIPFLLISYGELHITSSLTSLLIASEPLLVALFALGLDHRERVHGLRLVGLLIGMGGVITLLGLDTHGDGQQLLGAAFVLLATAGYALGALLIKRPAIASLPSLSVATSQCSIATLILFPLAITRFPSSMPSLQVIVSLLALGIICTAIAYLAFIALLSEVGASRGTVFTYINPAVAVFFGFILLGEPLSIATFVGFILIIVGSWLSTGGILPPLHSPRKRLYSTGNIKATKQENLL